MLFKDNCLITTNISKKRYNATFLSKIFKYNKKKPSNVDDFSRFLLYSFSFS